MTQNTVKTVVCLANSRKLSGRCIAAKEWDGTRAGNWIRPVSDRESEEVSEHERQYEDGSDPRVLDVVDIPLLRPEPRGCQTENWLLDPTEYWIKRGQLTWELLDQLKDPVDDLWNLGPSTIAGKNDKIGEEEADRYVDSLRFIELSELSLSVYAPGIEYGNHKRRVQAQFVYNNHIYWLWVTDPAYEREYLMKEDRDYKIGKCYVTVSLAEPYNGHRHKLVAAIIEKPE